MVYPAVGHFRYMKQPFDAVANVYESTEIGQTADNTLYLVALLEVGEGFCLGFGVLFFQYFLMGKDHIVPGAIQFDDLQLKFLTYIFLQIIFESPGNMTGRDKSAHTHVNQQAALYYLDNLGCESSASFKQVFQFIPGTICVSSLLG